MTVDELALLWRFKGGHSLARFAANPTEGVRAYLDCAATYSGAGVHIETKRDGIHHSGGQVIPWAAMRDHAAAHADDEAIFWIRAFDREWCEVKSMPDVKPGQWRYHTDAELARIAQCERWLRALAWEVWNPGTAEPEQLDLMDLLGAA